MSGAVVVTGVSTGIGHAVACNLLQRGYQVFGSVRQESDGRRLAGELGPAFTPLYFDVTDAEAVQCAVRQVVQAVGERGLAGLVNNAGISITGPLMHLPIDEIRWLFEVNVLGMIGVTQAFLPLLGAREGARHAPGRIVNIGSVSGKVVVPFMGAYAATKHAVEAVTLAFRRELKLYGIEAVTIEPSFIKTEIFGKNALQGNAGRFAGTGYHSMWQSFLDAFARAEKSAGSVDQVTQAVYEALSRKAPKTRYPLHPIWRLAQLLSDRQLDRVVINAVGLGKLLRR